MNDYKGILQGITETAKTWNDIKTELSKFNVHDLPSGLKDSRAGKIFELFTKHYFKVSPSEKGNYKNVWLFEEIPFEIRSKLNIGTVDYGVDLVLEDTEDLLFVVQCKFRNDENSVLNWTSDKIANLFAFCPNAYGYIVFSNASDLDNVSKTRHDKFTFYSIANLLEIDSETVKAIYEDITGNKEVSRKLFKPKPHQEKAISDCVELFEIENRGQLILPCGAGKTLTALWIKERLECRNTLVLVPSLALLRQIKNEWAKQRSTNYKYICVCSETDIDQDTIDSVVTHTYEVDVRVTTKPEQISLFLNSDYQEKVIFSTYHSLQSIADAIAGLGFEFDFIFCDEAHKTAGVGQNRFSLVHDNDKIPAKKRLYATATPRIVKESLKKKLGDDLKFAYDMNDPAVFGYEFHRMTFKEAIETGILVDYQIIAIGVNSEELKTYIENRNYVDSNITIDEIANNYALENVMNKYKANHAITFHSRVKFAEEFVNRHAKLFKSVNTFTVNGDQPTSHRNIVLDRFKNASKAVISNARCLTEGVDVPTIDLVYFSDPKNSKVDIVQAVGRALRKKEGKEKGYIVVPVYHTRRDDVENSISESSFKNLVQVIRSLCEQDERLQDEINSLAFAKGNRKSNRIDFSNTTFSEEYDIILLEGFEEKLKKSLFDQVIEKTSNNWDMWFLQFKDFLETHDSQYPTEEENIELYGWIAQQRYRRKNNTLKNEEIRKLKEVNFVWDMHEWKWDAMYSLLVAYSKENEFEPSTENNAELSSWYRTQRSLLASGKLREDRLPKINAVNFKAAFMNKWIPQYEDLVLFRKENPDKWPGYDKANTDTRESKLSVFCLIIRKRYRENGLDTYWFEKMMAIGFNFEGAKDNWTKDYEDVNNLIAGRDSISINEIGKKAYDWIILHKKLNKKGKLDDYKAEKVSELNLDRFFETWEEAFSKAAKWVQENNKIPSPKDNKDLRSWLGSQRIRYKSGSLTENQISALESIGFDLEGKGKEIDEQKWLDRLNEYRLFIEKEAREPSSFGEEHEKTLYHWVQAQRAVKAGSARNRKPLSKEREDALNAIGFQWVGVGAGNGETWEETFNRFAEQVDDDGNFDIPSLENGIRNPLYTWWVNQKITFDNGTMPETRILRFIEIGIDFNNLTRKAKKDGFIRWSKTTYKISAFFELNGRYPKRSQDKEENNLYQALARTRKLYKNGELSEKQLALLNELKIEME